MSIALSPTDFPEPVEPATRRCGIVTKSSMTGLPIISLPSTRGSMLTFWVNDSCIKISRNKTCSRSSLAISKPTTLRPGIGAMIRMLNALSASARSSSSAMILLILVSMSGLYSNNVITGPGRIAVTLPFTPK